MQTAEAAEHSFSLLLFSQQRSWRGFVARNAAAAINCGRHFSASTAAATTWHPRVVVCSLLLLLAAFEKKKKRTLLRLPPSHRGGFVAVAFFLVVAASSAEIPDGWPPLVHHVVVGE